MSGRIEQEVRRILAGAGTNLTLAKKELVSLVLKDDKLLVELVAPYLEGIAVQKLQSVRSGVSKPVLRSRPGVSAPAITPASPLAAAARGAVGKDMRAGYNPMRATAPNAPELGERPQASGRHVSTLKLLAAAFQVKRGERL